MCHSALHCAAQKRNNFKLMCLKKLTSTFLNNLFFTMLKVLSHLEKVLLVYINRYTCESETRLIGTTQLLRSVNDSENFGSQEEL